MTYSSSSLSLNAQFEEAVEKSDWKQAERVARRGFILSYKCASSECWEQRIKFAQKMQAVKRF
jgi:hypothetical protein